jgi:lipopolysaccharide/colanic/teichoic acid biosynthesis glycosyltransferase
MPYSMLKRLLDVFFCVFGLLILSPVLAVISCLVWVQSGRPILYRGVRTGLNGKPFEMLKFRTMYVGAEQLGGSSTAETDPRITPIGAVLRRFKLDELPQLLNVIRGEMSLVGPRPEVYEYTDLYSEEERLILNVRPGITDHASIKFRNLDKILATSRDPDQYYKDVIRPQKNQLRLHYARKHNLWIDFKLVCNTVKAVILRNSS